MWMFLAPYPHVVPVHLTICRNVADTWTRCCRNTGLVVEQLVTRLFITGPQEPRILPRAFKTSWLPQRARERAASVNRRSLSFSSSLLRVDTQRGTCVSRQEWAREYSPRESGHGIGWETSRQRTLALSVVLAGIIILSGLGWRTGRVGDLGCRTNTAWIRGNTARAARAMYRKPPLRLACSPSTNANRIQSSAGSLPYFGMWDSYQTMPLVGGFSRGSPVSAALSFRRCSNSPVALVGSQDLAVLRKELFPTSPPPEMPGLDVAHVYCCVRALVLGNTIISKVVSTALLEEGSRPFHIEVLTEQQPSVLHPIFTSRVDVPHSAILKGAIVVPRENRVAYGNVR
ncbi:hypothetical protein PR048_023810 [Dryococelus australis]|uniref:Uncharacterized protein n=1 Tax=Dryococelus australis TaxID=614101 RepID=A0ABQ9GV77_9NEOP|nr:hypothetical protein PR048_023810 [Dryococelus australis]